MQQKSYILHYDSSSNMPSVSIVYVGYTIRFDAYSLFVERHSALYVST